MDKVLALVERDTSTKIPKNVLEIELPVLIALFGEDRVHEISREPIKDSDVPHAVDAYGSMVRRYNTKEGGVALARVYRNENDVARAIADCAPSKPAPAKTAKTGA